MSSHASGKGSLESKIAYIYEIVRILAFVAPLVMKNSSDGFSGSIYTTIHFRSFLLT